MCTIERNILNAQIVDVQNSSNSKNSISEIKVRKLEKPSLGSLGMNTEVNSIMGLNIWQSTEAEKIIEHLNYLPDILASKHLQFFLNDLYLSTSVPPQGNSKQILKFLETRLFKVKNSGQSQKLYELVTQLPEGERWNIWRMWQAEYELINRQDTKACQLINKKSKNNSKNFWQMGRIFCLSIKGKRDQSEFILDLIKSRGFSDKIFEELFQSIYNKEKTLNFEGKKNNIQPLHVVMMDTLKIPIKVNYIAHLGVEYTDSLLSLDYLTPKARSFLIDKKINYSFVSVDKIIENYKSVADGNIDFELAFSKYIDKPDGHKRANVWLSIINMTDEIKKANSVLDIIRAETKNGRFSDVIELYLSILSEIDHSSLTKELNDSIKRLKVLSNPILYPDNTLANIILLRKNKKWDWDLVYKEKAWPLITIFEQSGMIQPDSIEWVDYLENINADDLNEDVYLKWENSFNLKRFILMKSIQEAAKNDNKALTVLLIARLIGDNPLVDFDLSNLIVIKSSLNEIGLENLGNKITQEVMTSKIINF